MKSRNRQAETEREIQRQWDARSPEERTPKHVEEFAEDMRRMGLRLKPDSTPNIHAVRGLLRAY